MLTIGRHIDATYQIIRENLAFCEADLFPDFARSLEAVFDDSVPSEAKLPWLALPIFVCEALGGDIERAQVVAAGLEIGRIAAACLDEWQDQDTYGALWQAIGSAQTITLATAMIGLSHLSLTRLIDLDTESVMVLNLQKEFAQTVLYMCEGQHADLSDGVSLSDYEKVAGAKTGSLLRLGCRTGAIVAGAEADVVARYGEFGYNLGILAQVWNDFYGLMGIEGKRDEGHSRTLPILAALALDGTQYLSNSAEEQAGQLYALTQIGVLHHRAVEALARCSVAGRLGLFLDAHSIDRLLASTAAADMQREDENGR